jgi:hypothetical protein
MLSTAALRPQEPANLAQTLRLTAEASRVCSGTMGLVVSNQLSSQEMVKSIVTSSESPAETGMGVGLR